MAGVYRRWSEAEAKKKKTGGEGREKEVGETVVCAHLVSLVEERQCDAERVHKPQRNQANFPGPSVPVCFNRRQHQKSRQTHRDVKGMKHACVRVRVRVCACVHV